MNVVLIGMKHCGKSTLGRALARRWGCPFHDVDAMIEATHACASGETLVTREIFSRHGEDYFHEVEGQVVCELYLTLERAGSTAVVALGGRTALNEAVSRLLGDIGLRVYLDVRPEELLARVMRSGVPPFLNPEDPEADFLALCRQRRPLYEAQADLVVNLDGLAPEQALEALVRRIEEHTHAR